MILDGTLIHLCGINSNESVYHTLLLELIKMFSDGVTLYKMAGGWGGGNPQLSAVKFCLNSCALFWWFKRDARNE